MSMSSLVSGLLCAATETRQISETASSRQHSNTDHTFANNVRFISMAAIIGVHSIGSYSVIAQLPSVPALLLYFEQPLKFGTIAFFLVAGFLFGQRIDTCSAFEYFEKRLLNVFVPWLVWFSAYFSLVLGADFIHGRLADSNFSQLVAECEDCLKYTAFWFVPNLLLCLAILLLFRPFLKSIRTGILFALASLFYAVNVYGHWVPVTHTRALFGFVFYLWLGAWCAWHFPALEKWIERIRVGAVVALLLLTLALALAESRLLYTLGSIDPMNTLRISNQVFSVVMVLAIMKLKRAVWPHFVDVRKHTFGLYLTHTSCLAVLASVLKRILPRSPQSLMWRTGTEGLLLGLLLFCLTYAGCLIVVRVLLSNDRLRWTVGLPAGGKNTVSESPSEMRRKAILSVS